MDEEKQRERMEMREDIREQEQKEDRIEESEIRKTVKRIKMKKVAEIDGIPTGIEICRRREQAGRFIESDMMHWYDFGRLEEEHSNAVI